MEEWYFTFGLGNPFLGSKFVRISGNFIEARNKMHEYFGDAWCNQYSKEEIQTLINKYGYTELKRSA